MASGSHFVAVRHIFVILCPIYKSQVVIFYHLDTVLTVRGEGVETEHLNIYILGSVGLFR